MSLFDTRKSKINNPTEDVRNTLNYNCKIFIITEREFKYGEALTSNIMEDNNLLMRRGANHLNDTSAYRKTNKWIKGEFVSGYKKCGNSMISQENPRKMDNLLHQSWYKQ